ncbi:MAG: helix-turn-helix domain-containing protein [Thalassobaculaceae bacterium]|nr:helix-turn-helix domain-containing protein [Thalassobaculaceae bacterium]
MINPHQCRGARALLGITQQQLAELAGISKRTVIEFEGGIRVPLTTTTQSLKWALESEGIEFLFGNGGGSGIRFKDPDFEHAMAPRTVSRRHVMGRVGVLAAGAALTDPLPGDSAPAATAIKIPRSFAATEMSLQRFEKVASNEQKRALELYRAGVTDVPDVVARRATMVHFDGERQIIDWQGTGIRLFPKARSLAGTPMAEQPDVDYGQWAESRVMAAFHRREPVFELCRGLVEVDGSRTVWRYYSLRLPRPDGTTLNVTTTA